MLANNQKLYETFSDYFCSRKISEDFQRQSKDFRKIVFFLFKVIKRKWQGDLKKRVVLHTQQSIFKYFIFKLKL